MSRISYLTNKLKMHMEEDNINRRGNLHIKLISTRLSQELNSLYSKLNLYCKVRVGLQIQFSKVLYNSDRFPTWKNQTIIIQKAPNDTLLAIELWNKQLVSKDDLIGIGQINLPQALSSALYFKDWIILLKNSRIFGHLKIEISFLPNISIPTETVHSPSYIGHYGLSFPGNEDLSMNKYNRERVRENQPSYNNEGSAEFYYLNQGHSQNMCVGNNSNMQGGTYPGSQHRYTTINMVPQQPEFDIPLSITNPDGLRQTSLKEFGIREKAKDFFRHKIQNQSKMKRESNEKGVLGIGRTSSSYTSMSMLEGDSNRFEDQIGLDFVGCALEDEDEEKDEDRWLQPYSADFFSTDGYLIGANPILDPSFSINLEVSDNPNLASEYPPQPLQSPGCQESIDQELFPYIKNSCSLASAPQMQIQGEGSAIELPYFGEEVQKYRAHHHIMKEEEEHKAIRDYPKGDINLSRSKYISGSKQTPPLNRGLTLPPSPKSYGGIKQETDSKAREDILHFGYIDDQKKGDLRYSLDNLLKTSYDNRKSGNGVPQSRPSSISQSSTSMPTDPDPRNNSNNRARYKRIYSKEKKKKIFEELKDCKHVTQVYERFQKEIPITTLYTWKQKDEKMLCRKKGSGRHPRWPELENELFDWYLFAQESGKYFSMNDFLVRAREMAIDKGIKGFTGTKGWCQNFMRRKNMGRGLGNNRGKIVNNNIKEEEMTNMISSYYSELNPLLNKYSFDQMWNIDELVIFFDPSTLDSDLLDMGNNSNNMNQEYTSRWLEKYRIRFTIILSFSASGEKLQPFIIFKEDNSSECERENNMESVVDPENIVITGEGYNTTETMVTHYLPFLSKYIPPLLSQTHNESPRDRVHIDIEHNIHPHILILMDKAACHKSECTIHSLERIYNINHIQIPNSCSCMLQPCEQGLSRWVKEQLLDIYKIYIVDKLQNNHKSLYLSREMIRSWVMEVVGNMTKDTVERAFNVTGVTDRSKQGCVLNRGRDLLHVEGEYDIILDIIHGEEELDVGGFTQVVTHSANTTPEKNISPKGNKNSQNMLTKGSVNIRKEKCKQENIITTEISANSNLQGEEENSEFSFYPLNHGGYK